MPYNPTIHHRRTISLKDYDYSQAGLYFVTICVQNHSCLFGEIPDNEMILNDMGKTVEKCWLEIVQHYPDVVLHEYAVMPNHVHGIIELAHNENDVPSVRAKNFSPFGNNMQTPIGNDMQSGIIGAKDFSPLPPPRGTSRTIGAIVRGFKIGVTKQLGFPVWQRNYWEHIIRNEQSYQNIANYIINNPMNWTNDKFYMK